MKKSFFQLTNQSIVNVEFIKNELFSNDDTSISLEFNHEISIKKLNKNEADVSLDFNIFDKEKIENYPFFVKVGIIGSFRWTDELKEEDIDNLLKTNAPAVLLSYIRSVISQLTAFSGYPSLIIPLINFK